MRGVLHVHPVLAAGTAREMAGARAYVARLAELASQYGFGFVERKPKPQPSAGAAAYLSSYFVKGRGRKVALWESVTSDAMPRSIVHVSVALTQATRCTMRSLRFQRALFVIWGATLPFHEAHAVRLILEVFGPSTQLIPQTIGDRAPPGDSDRRAA
jgi:hypothetical protein